MKAYGAMHAVVIGASMAGISAAQVLAQRFGRVTVVDRDAAPEGGKERAGVPQSFHQHVLLAAGRNVMEGLFPGLDRSLEQEGAELVDWGRDVLIFAPGGRVPSFSGIIETRPCTRTLLEQRARAMLASRDNVKLLWEREVRGVRLAPSGRCVAGVDLQRRGRPGVELESLAADLVVDASGRQSRMPEWLRALSWPTPHEQTVNPNLGYATRWYERLPVSVTGWKAVEMSTRAPDVPRAAGIWPVEGGRWIITLGGTGGHYPPVDEHGFAEFARTLIDPLVYETIRRAKPVSSIHGYRRTENRWRRYDRLARMPSGLVAIGDAVCCLNPIYGQGMTLAALSAKLLGRCLDAQTSDEPGRLDGALTAFRRALPGVLAPAWMLATSEDYRWPTTTGARPGLGVRIGLWYTDMLLDLAPEHGEVVEAFLQVSHMLQPPSRLVRPDIAMRVAQRLLLGGAKPTRARAALLSSPTEEA